MRWLILIVLLSSCSSQWHLRKAIAKDPTILTQGVVVETVTDTIRVEVSSDSLRGVTDISDFLQSLDTVQEFEFKENGIRAKVTIDPIGKILSVGIDTKPKTFEFEYTTEKTVIQPTVEKPFNWGVLIYVLLGLALIFLIFR